jgi:hypothetical protein
MQARAPLDPRQRAPEHHAAAGRGLDPSGCTQHRFIQLLVAEQQQGRPRAAQASRRASDGSLANGGGHRSGARLCGARCGLPGAVLGNDQGGDLAGRGECGLDRAGAVVGKLACGPRRVDPPRDGARERDDVARQRGVGRQVPGRVVADQVHDRRVSAPRVVQVCDAIGEARAQVEQRQRRPAGHARVAVGRARADALEQAQHGPDSRHRVERGDELNLGRAGVREADLDTGLDRRLNQTFGTVHPALPGRGASAGAESGAILTGPPARPPSRQ